MKHARWLLPALSLTLVLAFTIWDVVRSDGGPGPVHPAHAAVPALDGGANCAGCHRDGAVAAEACVQCHAAVGAQVEAGRGLHGSVQAGRAARCEWCHPEHHGDDVPLLPTHAFERVGVADPLAYDHAHVDFRLGGRHLVLTCDRCHAHAHDAAPPAGGRFLGLSQQCVSCHDDAHDGAFGGSCAKCHGQERAFVDAPGFAHDRFVLDGAHGRVACATCHAPDSERAVEREHDGLAVRACATCHADPHTLTSPTALRFDDTGDCARCHDTVAWQSARGTPAEHAAFGFALRGAHAAADCARCHGDAVHERMWAIAAPALARCGACHEHEHAPALVTTAVEVVGPADGCAGCHDDADARWAAGRVTSTQHAAVGFALAPPHGDLACSACHEGVDRAARFPGRAASDCRACHRDAHAGQFGADSSLRQCTECHAQHAFAPHRFGVKAHADVYPLTGAHDAVACAACHPQVVDGVRRFAGVSRTCARCHADPHDGRFDRPGLPAEVGARSGCARCHDTGGFGGVVGDFDHGVWTGFSLQASHATVACAACHDGPSSSRLGGVAGTRCADCHRDPHMGQFRVGGATDCARCHEARTWRDTTFDHGRHSRFALDETHAALACARCHVAWRVGEREVVRYKPLGTECGDCHRLGDDGGRR